jgi:hypothetical protein
MTTVNTGDIGVEGHPAASAVAASIDLPAKGGLMRFYTKPHQFSRGIDLHAHSMYVCILTKETSLGFAFPAARVFMLLHPPWRDLTQ